MFGLQSLISKTLPLCRLFSRSESKHLRYLLIWSQSGGEHTATCRFTDNRSSGASLAKILLKITCVFASLSRLQTQSARTYAKCVYWWLSDTSDVLWGVEGEKKGRFWRSQGPNLWTRLQRLLFLDRSASLKRAVCVVLVYRPVCDVWCVMCDLCMCPQAPGHYK